MPKNDYYNKQEYKTQKGIELFHDVKHELIDDIETFNEALKELDNFTYNSVLAERSRIAYYKKRLKIFGTEAMKKEKLERVINSFLFSISPELNLEVVKSNMFQKVHDNIHKFVYIEGESFHSTWIHKDVIYRDEFKILNPHKTSSRLLVMKSMKTPFELSRTSLNSTTIRLQFRKGWKIYIEEIKKGLIGNGNIA